MLRRCGIQSFSSSLSISLVLMMVMTTLAIAQVGGRQGFRGRNRPLRVPEGTIVHRNLKYVPGGHERHKLDLYLPAKTDTPLPVIVWIHGGAWLGGSKDGPGQVLEFLDDGYAVASINYRLSQHAIYPAQIEDCKAAVRWLRANAEMYNLDADHFAAWGPSAGGHLVALLGTSGDVKELEGDLGNLKQSSRVQAVIDFFGPTDFLQMDKQNGGQGMQHNTPNSPESRLIGGAIQDNVEKTQAANPIKYVSKDLPPFFIAHGELDPLVPVGQSELLRDALKKVGYDPIFRKIPGAGHGGPQFGTNEMNAELLEFLDKHLKAKLETER